MTDTPTPKRRGRKPIHVDGADRQAAYRERQARRAVLGEAARVMIKRPTLPFVHLLIGRLLGQAENPAAVRRALLDQLSEVSERGKGS